MLRRFTLSASTLALVAMASAAWAQDTDIETVTATGVRASVSGALTVKKDATQIIDSIVAEDIGKLPDSTVVESLQHVTGISIIRNNVEPNTVLIRGLPDVQTLVNGRQLFTSTGRSLQLPDLPSELLAQVDVHKASSATDISGGIAGLIDVRLHRPFDFDGFTLATSAQAVNESLAGHIDPQVSALISDRWNTDIGEIGLLLDVAYKDIHVREDEISYGARSTIIGPVPGAGSFGGNVCTMNPITNCPVRNTGLAAGPIGSGGLNVPYASGVRPGYAAESANISLFQRDGSIERASINLSSQWKPTQGLQFYAEMFYSRLRQKAPAFVDVKLRSNCPDAAASTVFAGTNIVESGASGCYSLTSEQDRRNKEDTMQFATGGDWTVHDHFTVTAEIDATISNVKSTNYIPDTAYDYGADAFTFVNNDGTGGGTVNTVGNPQDNPNNLILDQLFDQRTVSRGGDWAGRADAEYDFAPEDFIKSIQAGVRLSDRSAHNSGPSNAALNCTQPSNPTLAYNKYILATLASPVCQAYLAQGSGGNSPANFTHLGGITVASLGAGAAQRTIGDFFGGKYGETGWVTFNPDWLVDNIETIRNAYGYSGPQDDVPSTTFIVNEYATDGYLKANFGFEVFGFPVDGNFGARYVDTMLTEQAYLTNQNAGQISFTPTTARKESSDFLPSINVRLTAAEGLFFRVAASKTVTRPTFAQLNPAQSFSGAGQTLLGTSNSGNPNLSAEKSVNVDVDGEYYWGKANHVSLALFNRDVTGYIQTAVCTAAIAGCVNGQIVVNTFTYNYSLPQNFQNASIKGMEAAYSQFLDFLPGWLGGFGWDVNGTYLDGVFNNITKWHANAAGIYEYGPYSARVSYTWSSSYLQTPTFTPGVQPQKQYVRPRENLDASFNYTWNSHLVFSADATNILNSMQKLFGGKQSSQDFLLYNTDIAQFDRTFSIGARYKF
jgi:TonB-dependent receptor